MALGPRSPPPERTEWCPVLLSATSHKARRASVKTETSLFELNGHLAKHTGMDPSSSGWTPPPPPDIFPARFAIHLIFIFYCSTKHGEQALVFQKSVQYLIPSTPRLVHVARLSTTSVAARKYTGSPTTAAPGSISYSTDPFPAAAPSSSTAPWYTLSPVSPRATTTPSTVAPEGAPLTTRATSSGLTGRWVTEAVLGSRRRTVAARL
mmetsp:Transcript_5464/g.14250  ORF Transcript_5464/g.14250 Transcript_5464/m.14250 type:complete len:208 (-) Transcript_5464:1398-2021(-)